MGQAGQVADFLVSAAEEDGLSLVAEDGLCRGYGVAEALAGGSVLGYKPCDDGGRSCGLLQRRRRAGSRFAIAHTCRPAPVCRGCVACPARHAPAVRR